MTWQSTDFAAEKIHIEIATCIDYNFSRNSYIPFPSEENACIDYRYIDKFLYTIYFRGKTHTHVPQIAIEHRRSCIQHLHGTLFTFAIVASLFCIAKNKL
jgi:hypothetical protein